jgi:O-antigen/teichoic acid export membrane protein
MDVVIIQFLNGTTAVGTYTAGYRLVAALLALPAAAHIVLLPAFHRSASLPKEIETLFCAFRGILFELSLLILGGAFVLSRLIIELLYTEEYQNAHCVMRAGCLGVAIMFISYPYSMLAEACGRLKERLRWRLVAVGFGSVATILGAMLWQSVGAALGMAAGSAIYLFLLHWDLRRHVESPRSILLHCKAFVPAVTAGVAVMSWSPWFGQGLGRLVIAGALYTVLFCGIGRLWGIPTYFRPNSLFSLVWWNSNVAQAKEST